MTALEILNLIILGFDVALEGVDLLQRLELLGSKLAARAEAEGRDLTVEESAIIRAARDESARRRRGE